MSSGVTMSHRWSSVMMMTTFGLSGTWAREVDAVGRSTIVTTTIARTIERPRMGGLNRDLPIAMSFSRSSRERG
jgi:hypothetical protein